MLYMLDIQQKRNLVFALGFRFGVRVRVALLYFFSSSSVHFLCLCLPLAAGSELDMKVNNGHIQIYSEIKIAMLIENINHVK